MSKRLAFLVLVVGLAACGNSDTKLKVTSIEPNQGAADGDQYVKVHGNGFMSGGVRSVKIYFGGQPGEVTRTASDSELIVHAPGGTQGQTVDVLIEFEPGGEIKLPKAYTFIDKQPQGQPSANKIDWKSVK
jgi:hypothetical protein